MSNIWIVGNDVLAYVVEMNPLVAFREREEAEAYIESQKHPDMFSLAEAEIIHIPVTPMKLPASKYRCSFCKTPCNPTYDIKRAANLHYNDPWCDTCRACVVVEKVATKLKD